MGRGAASESLCWCRLVPYPAVSVPLAALAGVPPGTVAAYRRGFMGLPSAALRRAHYAALRGFAARADAAAAAAWMAAAGGAA